MRSLSLAGTIVELGMSAGIMGVGKVVLQAAAARAVFPLVKL